MACFAKNRHKGTAFCGYMQIESKKSANFFKFVLLCAVEIGGVSSAHGEVFCKQNVNVVGLYTIFAAHGAADRTPCG